VRFIAEADQVAVDPPTFSRVVKALTLGRLDSATANRLRTIFRRLSRAAHGRDLGPERTAELLGRIRNLITTPPPAARMTGTG
jgi:hypothetical protein